MTVHGRLIRSVSPYFPAFRHARIRARRGKSGARVLFNLVGRLRDGDEEVAQGLDAAKFFVVPLKRPKMLFGFWRKRDQTRRAAPRRFSSSAFASSRRMLSRNRSRAGSSGTVRPASTCASLSSSSAIHSESVRLVGSVIPA